ncbi:MAG: hypothetical protein ACLFNN_01865 [Candidatus Paceibacterota bacterium]
MIWFKKMMVAHAIAELPAGQREQTRKIWNILNQIELHWTWYPLNAAMAVTFGFLVWLGFGGHMPLLGLAPWATGFAWAVIIYLVMFPLAKAVLLSRTKRLLRELKVELATVEGNRAGELLNELDRRALWVAKRAAQRNLFCWIW